MNKLFFNNMLLAGLVPLVLIHVVLAIADRAPRGKRSLRTLAFLLAVPPLGFFGPTLASLPSWAQLSWLLVGGILFALCWRFRQRLPVHPALILAAYTVTHTYVCTWTFWAIAPGCTTVWKEPGAQRLDKWAPIERSILEGSNRGEYAVEVDPEEGFVYATYAHGGRLNGVAKLPLRAQGAHQLLKVGSGGILHARFEARHRRIYAVDHNDKKLYVLGEDPFELIDVIATGSDEPMDISFDPDGNRAMLIDRTEQPKAPTPEDRPAGVLLFDLDDPTKRVGRIALGKLPGANEFVQVPGERRAFIPSEGFPSMQVLDYGKNSAQELITFLPGCGGGAVDTFRREIYLTHTVGWVQVRDIDDFAYKRSLFVRGARAVAVDPRRNALYVSDFFNGWIKRIDPEKGTTLGKIRVGSRMRQMRVLRDGRLLTASACGIVVLDPP